MYMKYDVHVAYAMHRQRPCMILAIQHMVDYIHRIPIGFHIVYVYCYHILHTQV